MEPAPQLYQVCYTAGSDGQHYIALRVGLTLAQAERFMRSLKRQGRTTWVETAEGAHVPVKGAKRDASKHYAHWPRSRG